MTPLAVAAVQKQRLRSLASPLSVVALSGGLGLLAVLLHWHGQDFPAQLFRADIVHRYGYIIWNSQWYGGHALLSYSVLTPIVGSAVGLSALSVVTAVASAVLFERILYLALGRHAPLVALWFALATAVNLINGRVTFGFGAALGLAALYLLLKKHTVWAVVASILCPLASPLAGAFLALALVIWFGAKSDRRPAIALVAAGALAPILVLYVLFPASGPEPYGRGSLIFDLALCLLLVWGGWDWPLLRYGALLYGVCAIGSYYIPSLVGSNVSRLGEYLAVPLLILVLFPKRRVLLFLLAVPLFVWQCYPAFDAVAYARSDPSTSPAFYTPLLSYLHAQPGLLGRVEIPMTYRHWESAYAGTSIMLARGWERQLDIAYNPIFYNQPLTSLSYHTWLTTNGVEYVALPHAALDSSSFTEQRLLESPVPYLKPVWSSANWTVWRVTDYSGLVQGQATLSAVSPDRLVLEVTAPGTLKLRFRSSPRWDTNHNGCADATPAGWLVLENVHPGPLILKQSLRGSPCG